MDRKRPDALSIPNLITYFRLLLIPLFVLTYYEENYVLALACLALSAVSDVADGYIARHYHMVTDLGKFIDPVADKLTQAAMFFCVARRIPSIWILFGFLAVKELVMLLWGSVILRRTGEVNSARWYGKVCTAVLYASMALLVLLPDLPRQGVDIITGVCGAVMLMSLVLYSRWYLGILRTASGGEKRRLTDSSVIRSHVSMVASEIILVVLLVCAVLSFVYRNDITVEGILRFTPSNLWLAVLVFMGLFAVKSLTVVVYVKLLYIAAGVVFPLPLALAVCAAGTVIELTIPYLMGRFGGKSAAELILQRRPGLRRVTELRNQNNLWFCVFTRAVGVLPVDPMSIYLGAAGVPFGEFLLGSVLGSLPVMAITVVLGAGAEDPSSPAFIISAVLFVLLQAAAILAFFLWIRRNRELIEKSKADREDPDDEYTE